jgi:ESCRT-II complex subunit VPS22
LEAEVAAVGTAMSHRRGRRVGVGHVGASKYVQKKADEMKAVSLQSALDTVEKLEVKLTDFAKQHAKEIQHDPVFRQRFLKMCAPLGVDPLASKQSFWGKVLGMGDFYHELAVKVAEVCLASRARNGGIMSVTEVQDVLEKRRTRLGTTTSQAKVSTADIQVAITKLAKLGGGFRTIEVGKSTMVVSVPTELDNDHMTVMSIANNFQDHGVKVVQVIELTGWTMDRAERSLKLLLQEGIAWLDTKEGIDYYWLPSIWQECTSQTFAKEFI